MWCNELHGTGVWYDSCLRRGNSLHTLRTVRHWGSCLRSVSQVVSLLVLSIRESGRRSLLLAFAAMLGLSAPSKVHAQLCADTDPCGPPSIQVQINGSSSVASAPLSILVSDDGTLNMASWQIWYNGVDVSSWIGGAGVVDDPGNSHTSVSVSGLFTLTQGTFWLTSRICDTGTGSSCTADSVQVTYSPPPPPPARARPVVTLAHRNVLRSLDGCATCASATTAYSTPAFFANGTALSTTLRYSSELAKPTGYVEVDVKVSSTTVPTRLRMRQTLGRLLTGETAVF